MHLASSQCSRLRSQHQKRQDDKLLNACHRGDRRVSQQVPSTAHGLNVCTVPPSGHCGECPEGVGTMCLSPRQPQADQRLREGLSRLRGCGGCRGWGKQSGPSEQGRGLCPCGFHVAPMGHTM